LKSNGVRPSDDIARPLKLEERQDTEYWLLTFNGQETPTSKSTHRFDAPLHLLYPM